MDVAVCIITYRRPQGLNRLLESLDRQTFAGPCPTTRVVVVDNDPEASARATCEAWRKVSGWTLEYVVEAKRGIPFARNTAIDRAKSAEWVAFLDDDEEASTEWLDQVLTVQRQYDADVVAGPVVPQFDEDVSSWVIEGGFFDRPRHATGERLPVAFSGNVLIRSSILQGEEIRFDERLRHTGGSDSHFFRRLASRGHRVVWADAAIVRETIPASKATARWLVRRSFRTGITLSFIDVDAGRGLSTYPLAAAKGVTWLVVGTGVCLTGLLLGHAMRVRGARWWAFGIGRLAGLVGQRYDEYQTTHGT